MDIGALIQESSCLLQQEQWAGFWGPAVEGLQPELLEEQAEQWRALAAGVREASQRAGQAGRGDLAGTLEGVAHKVSGRKETECAFGNTRTAGAALLYRDPHNYVLMMSPTACTQMAGMSLEVK